MAAQRGANVVEKKKRSKKKPSQLNKMEKPGRVLVTKKGEFNHAIGILKNTKSDLKIS